MTLLRSIPAIHQLKNDPRYIHIKNEMRVGDVVLTEWLDEVVNIIRQQLVDKTVRVKDRETLTELIFQELGKKTSLFTAKNLQKVVNLTGVVLHTNLGRARLSEEAIDHITDTAATYSTLEYDVESGKRGSRHSIVEEYLQQLTGAEAAMVVNNNAAAVFLVLKAIASEKEVIVSRGELVEIGGSFRISDIMKESNATLVEVGTTNKTHRKDYEEAITEETALFLKVHKSNFAMIGFTEEVDTNELVELSRTHGIPIYDDLGSGTLFDFKKANIGTEPTVQEKMKSGIDIVSFSGDKLLGGPQAGIIVGKKKYIDKMKQHQLARVLRVDKFTLAALEATCKAYLKGEETREIPTVRDITEPSESVLEKANQFMEHVQRRASHCSFIIQPSVSKVGGGTMPEVELETYVVVVEHPHIKSSELAERLRKRPIPIVVRVKNEQVIADFRTVQKEEMDTVIDAFLEVVGEN